jgi:hypothetical protein
MRSIVFFLILVVTPIAAAAQTAVSVETGPFVLGDGDGSAATIQLGFRVGSLQANTVHADFAFATLPEAIANGILFGIADFDLGYDQRLATGLSLAVRGGGSTLFGLSGEGGAGFLLGYNVGGGIVTKWGECAGVRLDFTYRRIAVDRETYPTASLTLGIVVHR